MSDTDTEAVHIMLVMERHGLDQFAMAYREVLAIGKDCDSYEEMQERVPEHTAEFLEEYGAEVLHMIHSGYSLMLEQGL